MRHHKVAIQGTVSSFHDLAARRFYGEDLELVCCTSFREVCEKVMRNEADYAVMAIENFTAGSILSNYNLIEEFNLTVIGETYERIQFHLMGNKGVQISDAIQVLSHPMALAQCQEFLCANPNLQPIEFSDTAGAAKKIAMDGDNDKLAIGNEETARTYGLDIIQANIETNKQNYTRFLVLTKYGTLPEETNKASISFRTENEPNALVKVLQVFSSNGLNCTKIQSVPLPNTQLEYSFHLDIEFSNHTLFRDAFESLEAVTASAKILGEYPRNPVELEKNLVLS